jgi:hypothetical protein
LARRHGGPTRGIDEIARRKSTCARGAGAANSPEGQLRLGVELKITRR